MPITHSLIGCGCDTRRCCRVTGLRIWCASLPLRRQSRRSPRVSLSAGSPELVLPHTAQAGESPAVLAANSAWSCPPPRSLSSSSPTALSSTRASPPTTPPSRTRATPSWTSSSPALSPTALTGSTPSRPPSRALSRRRRPPPASRPSSPSPGGWHPWGRAAAACWTSAPSAPPPAQSLPRSGMTTPRSASAAHPSRSCRSSTPPESCWPRPGPPLPPLRPAPVSSSRWGGRPLPTAP